MKLQFVANLLAILQLLTSLCLAALSQQNDRTRFLSSFSARSLVHVRYNVTKLPHDRPRRRPPPDETLEVEEIYDGERKLGKVVVYSDGGQRTELYARPIEGLYMVAHFNDLGTPLIGCRISQQPPKEGYFALFSELTDNDQLADHLIGPATIVYKLRQELLGKWADQEQQSVDTAINEEPNSTQSNDLEPDEPDRKRLLVSPNSVQLTSGRRSYTFMRSDFQLERAPLLRELASSFESNLEDGTGRELSVDLLSLSEVDLKAAQQSWDPFRLPAGFECDNAHEELKRDFYKLDKSWARKLPISSDWMSATMFASGLQSEGVDLMMDLTSGLTQFNIRDRSSSIIDVSKALLYFKPNERSIGSTQDATESQSNTAECTVLSTDIFLATNAGDETIKTLGVTVLDRWHFLVGHASHMIYLGQVLYHERRLAHELQLSYDSVDQLPAYFSLMINKHEDHWNTSAYGLILAKLWIAADVLTCADIYSLKTGSCEDFVVLGYRVELVSNGRDDLRVYWRDEVQMVDFQWIDAKNVALEQPYKVFDLRHCPLDRLMLTVDVGWKEISSLATQRSGEGPELDDVVARELGDYLHLVLSIGNLQILSLERQLQAPGSRSMRYLLTLAQYPTQSIGFKLVANELAKESLGGGELLNQVSNRRSLFECLTWASQYSGASAALYSPKCNECLVYSSYQLASNRTSTFQGNAGDYQLFDRRAESTRASNDSLREFIRDQLDSLNTELKKDSKRSNKLQALIDGSTLAKDIRLSPLKVVPESLGKQGSTRTQIGYRFANIHQTECNSLVQCQSLCLKEVNCNAFAYCRYPDTKHEFCQLNLTSLNIDSINNKTSPEKIKAAEYKLTRDAGCEIHVKDYLHYFQPEVSSRTSLRSLGKVNRWHPMVQNVSEERDCAMACYSMPAENICMRFIFCPQSEATRQCLLWLEDVITDKELLEASGLGEAVVQGESDQTDCSLLKRKSITLYERVMETKSRGFNWQGDSLTQTALRNVDKDQCAERCTRNAECLSFDSCLVKQTFNSRTFISLECVQLSGSIFNPSQMYILNKESETERNKESISHFQEVDQQQSLQQCSHYERLAAKNQLTSRQAEELVKALAAGRADSDHNTSHSKTSFAGGLFGAAVLGLAVGVSLNCISILWKAQKQRRRHRQVNAAVRR